MIINFYANGSTWNQRAILVHLHGQVKMTWLEDTGQDDMTISTCIDQHEIKDRLQDTGQCDMFLCTWIDLHGITISIADTGQGHITISTWINQHDIEHRLQDLKVTGWRPLCHPTTGSPAPCAAKQPACLLDTRYMCVCLTYLSVKFMFYSCYVAL